MQYEFARQVVHPVDILYCPGLQDAVHILDEEEPAKEKVFTGQL
jgi:hypothetical protein